MIIYRQKITKNYRKWLKKLSGKVLTDHPDLRIDKNTSKEYQTRLEYRFEHLSSKAAVKYSPDSYGMGEYYNYELGVAVPVKKLFSVETR